MSEEPKLKPIPKRPAPIKRGPSLTFSDGLNFGCGFWVAGFLFFVIGVPVIVFLLAMIGVNL